MKQCLLFRLFMKQRLFAFAFLCLWFSFYGCEKKTEVKEITIDAVGLPPGYEISVSTNFSPEKHNIFSKNYIPWIVQRAEPVPADLVMGYNLRNNDFPFKIPLTNETLPIYKKSLFFRWKVESVFLSVHRMKQEINEYDHYFAASIYPFPSKRRWYDSTSNYHTPELVLPDTLHWKTADSSIAWNWAENQSFYHPDSSFKGNLIIALTE